MNPKATASKPSQTNVASRLLSTISVGFSLWRGARSLRRVCADCRHPWVLHNEGPCALQTCGCPGWWVE